MAVTTATQMPCRLGTAFKTLFLVDRRNFECLLPPTRSRCLGESPHTNMLKQLAMMRFATSYAQSNAGTLTLMTSFIKMR